MLSSRIYVINLASFNYQHIFYISVTTRPPREGEEQMNTYTFVSREDFEEGIRQNKFLEFGEKDGNLYGTSVESVREVIRYLKYTVHRQL